MARKAKKEIKIYGNIGQIDWFSFNQIYSQIISNRASIFFMNLVFQDQLNKHLGQTIIPITVFLDNYRLKEEEFEELLAELSQVELIKILCKQKQNKNEEKVIEIGIKIGLTESIWSAFKNKKMIDIMESSMNSNKFEELKYIYDQHESGEENSDEITIGQVGQEEISKERKEIEIVDKEIYSEFYNGVMQRRNEDFLMDKEIIRTLIEYGPKGKDIKMKKLQEFGEDSLVFNKAKGKLEIHPIQFRERCEREINGIKGTATVEEIKEFWKEIFVKEDGEILLKYEKLFKNYQWDDLYRVLVGQKIGVGLNNLIKRCISMEGFNQSVIKGLLSFTFCLLGKGKIPLNYFRKVVDTLKKDHDLTVLGLLNWARIIANSDLEKENNRLGVYMHSEEKLSSNKKRKQGDKKTNVDDSFVTYFNSGSI